MMCLDLGQYVVHVMTARAQSDKLPGFYMQIALFEFRMYKFVSVSVNITHEIKIEHVFSREDSTLKTFIICALYQVLLG